MNATARSLALVLFAWLLAPVSVTAASPTAKAASPRRYVQGEVLVKFHSRSTARAAAAVSARGHHLLRSLTPSGLRHVKLGPGESVAAAMAAYGADPDVEYVQPNYVYTAAAVPNDPQYGQLWGLRNTGQTISPADYPTNNPGTVGSDARVERAWDVLTDCSSTVVAVIDSGVNYAQEDLAANMWSGGATHPNHGFDFVDDDDDPMDLNGHGTHVAGTIGAVGDNGRGVVGVCWTAQLMAVRVLGPTGSGSTAGIIQGIHFAIDRGAKVVNMSLGGGGAFDRAFSDAITAAQQADVVVIVAAGNAAEDVDGGAPTYPCAFTHPNLVCVAALDQAYALADFSNYGATSVDVGAPGTNIRSAWTGAETTIEDPLSGGWVGSSSTGTGWAFSVLGGVTVLVDPDGFPAGRYRSGTDDRVFKTFDLAGADAASLEVAVVARVAVGDHVSAACSNVAADPFSGQGVTLFESSGAVADGELVTADLTACAGAPASIGFRLVSDASVTDQGLAIGLFTITKLRLDAASYETIDGTSMAAPLVAGIATLLRSQNPLYTAADVVSALEAAGRPVAALAGKTTSGRAVDASATLAHIRPPTGLAARVE